jgi:hypothetical protein
VGARAGEEMLTMEQREVVKIFLPYIFLALHIFPTLLPQEQTFGAIIPM